MADITKCNGKNCPLKEDCYRFTAPVSKFRQSYFVETPKLKDGDCSEFWSNKNYKKNDKRN